MLLAALAAFPILSVAAPDAAAPARQPQLAADGAAVTLVFGAGDRIYASTSSDGGVHFDRPVLVGSAGVLSLGRHRGARVARAGSRIVVTAIAGEQGRGRDGELWAWRSSDSGRTWSKAVRVTSVPGSAREGLHTMAVGPDGRFFTAWLDLRTNHTVLLGSVSTDAGATWSANFPVYESPEKSICECCHPSAALGPAGAIHVLFRNSLAGARDLWLATGKAGAPFQSAPSGEGTWILNACPMDGGGIAIAEGGRVQTVWRRERSIFWTDGKRFHAPGWTGKDPAIAADTSGTPFIAWTEGTAVKLYHGEVETLDAAGGYPALAASPLVAVGAWESADGIKVRRLR